MPAAFSRRAAVLASLYLPIMLLGGDCYSMDRTTRIFRIVMMPCKRLRMEIE
jgi:hypothetical protein